ncbi:MAG: site-specific DNA-methyltransferase [Firmicutes bacterium]|nr:site-specific DNA-methyltransferase [Bacillota bacterium]
MFPNCITEKVDENGKIKKAINFELLKQMLLPDVVEGDERYEFTWVGKKAAIVEANKPIRKTLRPVMNDETVPTGADSEGKPYCSSGSKNWDTTENLYIEGDNMEVLKLLQESYLGKVKMIYIDPPYNTGNDFIYADDFMHSQEEENQQMGMYDEETGDRLFKNTDTNGRFHSDWCSMIYSRLMLARNLLTDDGVIFISIGDEELNNLKNICDEIFGAKNFIANLIWQSTPGSNTGNDVKTVTENILLYSKSRSECNFLNQEIIDNEKYSNLDEYYEKRGGFVLNKLDRRMTGNHYSEALNYSIEMPDGSVLYPGNSETKQEHWNWRWSSTKVKWGIDNGFVIMKKGKNGWSLYFKQYEKVDNEDKLIKRTLSYQNLLNIDGANSARGTREVMDLFNGKFFDYPKPLNLIKHIQSMILSNNDIVMDFFSGSATTAHAVMQLNAKDGGHRKFIMVQLPEKCDEKSEAYKAGYKNICEIGKERIRRAGEKIKSESPLTTGDLDVGFRVLKLDDTNMKDVYYAPDDYSQGLLAQLESNIKEDRTDLDLLFGCLLDWGLPLSMPYYFEQIDGCTIHTYNDGDLIACFDENVSDSVVKEIAKRQPLRAVFRDSSFANSPAKINVEEIFKLLALDTRVKVI